MRVARLPLLVIVTALFAALLPPGSARSAGILSVADVQARFTIGFPVGWRISTPSGDTPAVHGIDPRSRRPSLNVNVVIEQLPQPLSPVAYARKSRPLMAAAFHDFVVLQEGPARIAKRESFYRYYTWKSPSGYGLYQVQAYFTVGRQGFVLTGTTANDPDRIRKDVPVISRIFETFAPTVK